jgi:hypothetical protein
MSYIIKDCQKSRYFKDPDWTPDARKACQFITFEDATEKRDSLPNGKALEILTQDSMLIFRVCAGTDLYDVLNAVRERYKPKPKPGEYIELDPEKYIDELVNSFRKLALDESELRRKVAHAVTAFSRLSNRKREILEMLYQVLVYNHQNADIEQKEFAELLVEDDQEDIEEAISAKRETLKRQLSDQERGIYLILRIGSFDDQGAWTPGGHDAWRRFKHWVRENGPYLPVEWQVRGTDWPYDKPIKLPKRPKANSQAIPDNKKNPVKK